MQIRPSSHRRENSLHEVQKPGRGFSPAFPTKTWDFQPVRVVGRPLRMEVERAAFPEKIDHFWITISVVGLGPVLLTINTTSLRNRRANFDDRIRVGRITQPYRRLPPAGMSRTRLLNYRSIEENANVFYESKTQTEMEQLLENLTNQSEWIQAWGVAFNRRILGVHQIHCRRASCAVPEDIVQMDGALRFYRKKDNQADLLLLKFCGQ